MTDKDLEKLADASLKASIEYYDQDKLRSSFEKQALVALWTANALLADIALSLRYSHD